MAKPLNEIPDVIREVNRYTANVLNKGVAPIAEEIVKELQARGPSWTGLYSNSWQIEIGGQKSTGTRRPGEPKPVKAPIVNVSSIRSGRATRNTIEVKIRNLARSRGYAQDEKEGRFRRGKFKSGKEIEDKPKTKKGNRSFEQQNQGRVIGFRGDIGGGKDSGISSRTAPLDWFETYKQGGHLQQTVKLELAKKSKQVKSRSKKLK